MIAPGAVWKPVPSHSGAMNAHTGLVLHVQQGDNSPYGWFSVPSNQASSHWWVAKNGTLEQYVESDDTAWGQAAGNGSWSSVETEGFDTEPLTTAQVQTLAALYAWGHRVYGWPLVVSESVTTAGFGWHGMGGASWGGHLGCPGDIRKSQRAAVLYLAALTLAPPQGVTDTMDNLTFIRWAYLEYLLREPDPGGFSTYNTFLSGGGSRGDVIAKLVDSPEGQKVLAAKRKVLAL